MPVTESLGIELVDVEYIKEGSNWYVRVYIDKDGGVTVNDCEKVSNQLGAILDKEDPIPHRYYLEVSSPGLERPLKKDKDFERYKGDLIEVKLYKPLDNKYVFEGELLGLEDNKIILKVNNKVFKFDKQEVARAKRVFKF